MDPDTKNNNENNQDKKYKTPEDKIKKLEEEIASLGFNVKETEDGEIRVEE